MTSSHFFLAVAGAIALFRASESVQDLDRRVAVVNSSMGLLAFTTDFSQGTMKVATSTDDKTWGELCVG